MLNWFIWCIVSSIVMLQAVFSNELTWFWKIQITDYISLQLGFEFLYRKLNK